MGIVSAIKSFFSPKPAPAPSPPKSSPPPTNSTSPAKAPTITIPSPFTPTPTKSNPFVPNRSGGGGGSSIAPTSSGTYDSSTGTYTDSSGNSQSRAVAPQGATLVGGGKTTYSGGSSGGGGSSISSTSNPLEKVFPTINTASNPFTQAIQEKKLSVAPTTNSKAGGTYNPMTQTYTDKSGLGYSMKPSDAINLTNPLSKEQVTQNLRTQMEADKSTYVVGANLNNLNSMGLNKDYKYVGADTTSNTLSQPSFVRNDKLDTIKPQADMTKTTLGDIWAGSPFTLHKSTWANIESKSGTTTPEEAKAVQEKIKTNTPNWLKTILPVVATYDAIQDWKLATEFSRKSRVSGMQLDEEQKFSVEQANKIDKKFSDEWNDKRLNDLSVGNADLNAQVDIQNKKVEELKVQNTDYENKVENFNKRFGGKELEQSEYEQAIKEQAKLESERNILLAQKNEIDLTGKNLDVKLKALEEDYSHYKTDEYTREGELHNIGYSEKKVKRGDVEKVSTWGEIKNLNFGKAYENFDVNLAGGKLPGGKSPEEAKAYKDLMNEEITIGTTQAIETPNVPLYYKQKKQVVDKYGAGSWQSVGYSTAMVGEKGLEIAELSWLGAEAGIIPLAQAKMGWIGTHWVTKGGLQWGKGLLIGSGVVMTGATLYSKSKSGMSNYEKMGMSGTWGAIEGLAVGGAEVGGFMLGASKGALSPIKYEEAKLQDLNSPAQAGSIGFENPFNPKGKFYPVATWNEKGWGLGWGKKSSMSWTSGGEAGVYYPINKFGAGYVKANLGLNMEKVFAETTLGIAGKNYKTKVTPGTWDMEKVRVFNNIQDKAVKQAILDIQAQEGADTRGLRGFWNAGVSGVQQYYGGVSTAGKGGFKGNVYRADGMTSDADIVYYDEAEKHAKQYIEAITKAGGMARVEPGSIGAVEVKTGKGWEKLFDLHGTDTPELMIAGNPWGLGLKQPVLSMDKNTGKLVPTSPGINEFIGKIGGTMGVSVSKNGNVILTSEAKRMPKDIFDLSSQAENWFAGGQDTSIKSGTGDVAKLKRLIQTNWGINVETGSQLPSPNKIWVQTGVEPWAVNPTYSLTPSEISKQKKVALDVFLPENPTMKNSKKVQSATWDAFMPAKVKSTNEISKWTSEVSRIHIPSPSPSRSGGSWSLQTSWSGSPSVSPSMSISPSPSLSQSLSKSLSKSLSISKSSKSPSPSISNSPSMSPSKSPSMSPSMSQNTFVWQAPVVFPVPDLSGWGQGKQGKSPQRTRKQNVYTPDFTAKTIGIEQKITKAQMKKLLRKTLTGLEIRPGVWT